jgi:hypothetical protein
VEPLVLLQLILVAVVAVAEMVHQELDLLVPLVL